MTKEKNNEFSQIIKDNNSLLMSLEDDDEIEVCQWLDFMKRICRLLLSLANYHGNEENDDLIQSLNGIHQFLVEMFS